MEARTDRLLERTTIELVTTHRAIARGGLGLTLPSIPSQAFSLLSDLERHCAGRPDGRKVWSILSRLQAIATSDQFTDISPAIERASMITAFSNFPIGLLRLPGDTDPLMCRIPIAYRPLLPLTRTLQQELRPLVNVDLTDGFRVLVAECIPEGDPVEQPSRAGWDLAMNLLSKNNSPRSMSISRLRVPSPEVLRSELTQTHTDILVLSAHGGIDPSGTVAGISIGQQLCIGPELGPMPPIVILSACQVAPRGGGTISIADLLL